MVTPDLVIETKGRLVFERLPLEFSERVKLKQKERRELSERQTIANVLNISSTKVFNLRLINDSTGTSTFIIRAVSILPSGWSFVLKKDNISQTLPIEMSVAAENEIALALEITTSATLKIGQLGIVIVQAYDKLSTDEEDCVKAIVGYPFAIENDILREAETLAKDEALFPLSSKFIFTYSDFINNAIIEESEMLLQNYLTEIDGIFFERTLLAKQHIVSKIILRLLRKSAGMALDGGATLYRIIQRYEAANKDLLTEFMV